MVRQKQPRDIPSRKVRIGIAGVGNCASSLVQGLSYYKEAKSNEPVPGLMNASVGGYHVSDIEGPRFH
jgi:myo-inositol-1-phosphate synthase